MNEQEVWCIRCSGRGTVYTVLEDGSRFGRQVVENCPDCHGKGKQMKSFNEQLREHLEALGNTAEEVAASLERHGIKGTRFQCNDCPLTNYINKLQPERGTARVGAFYVMRPCEPLLLLPCGCLAFRADFDSGKFPQLESLRERALYVLRKLGDTPDDIAATLEAAGIKGLPGISTRCPLSEYLKKILVIEDVCISKNLGWLRKEELSLPTACQQFILAFDANKYPQLEIPTVTVTCVPLL